jgi:starch-binding outer membrane protein, SusD/RagB family
MKKILIISTSVFLVLFSSCKKGFLDKNPTDQLANETFWKTEEDVNMGLTGVYNVMTDRSTFNHGRMLWDGLSDIAFVRDNSIAQGNIEVTTGGWVTSIYNDCYVGISRCNNFLANVDNAQMDEGNRTKDKAEVYFLRGYFYFILTEFYGGVPLYTKPPASVEASKVKQSTKDEVVAQVLKDLDLAIAGLPDDAYTGHAVKGSALSLKAKVLMHNQRWAEAATAAKQVIQSGKFSLYNNYQNLFLTVGQDNNPEIIFSVKFLLPDAPTPTTSDMNPDLIGGHAHIVSPIQNYVDSFECTDGLTIAQSPLYDPTNYKKNRDPRLKYIVADSSQWAAYKPASETGESWSTAYIVNKYVNWANAPYSWAKRSDQDYIVLRYAEVLLIYAESQNEASGTDQSVYDAVNAVRARPGVNMPALPAGLGKAGMRVRIRREREVELGMEGLRYLDIKRWKTAETIIPTIVDPGGYRRKFDPAKNYLWPFSLSERDVNPNLNQNPNY